MLLAANNLIINAKTRRATSKSNKVRATIKYFWLENYYCCCCWCSWITAWLNSCCCCCLAIFDSCSTFAAAAVGIYDTSKSRFIVLLCASCYTFLIIIRCRVECLLHAFCSVVVVAELEQRVKWWHIKVRYSTPFTLPASSRSHSMFEQGEVATALRICKYAS